MTKLELKIPQPGVTFYGNRRLTTVTILDIKVDDGVGLILFLVWRDNKPKNAKAAGIGALISVGCSILYWMLVSCVGIGVGFLGA